MAEVAEEYFPSPKQKGAFLLATSDDGTVTAGLHHFPGLLPDHANYCFKEPAAFTNSADVPVEGKDMWTRNGQVKLSHEYPSAIVSRQAE